MEFWGTEVKAGQTIKCNPATDGKLLHLSQASLGEIKKDKGSDSILLFVKVGGQKFVIGTLSSEKFPSISFDLVFEREFELSHNCKTGSVYFCGYYTIIVDDEEPEEFTDTDSDSAEENALLMKENGNKDGKDKNQMPAGSKVNAIKSDLSDTKSLASITEAKKSNDTSDNDESEEESSDDEMTTSESEDESDESDDESSDEDAAARKKVETGKKRPLETVAKTPTSEKKAKLAIQSGQKSGTDGKKGSHKATPYPSKQRAGGKHGIDNKSSQNTPNSGGQVICKSCSKTFKSEIALQSHTKAKHSASK